MRKYRIWLIVIFILLLVVITGFFVGYRNSEKYAHTKIGQKWEPKSFEENRSLIVGNRDDLITFSIWPETKVHGVISYRGVIKGGYFFEGNILINILDTNNVVIKRSNAIATSDWMIAGPVNFEGNIDFTNLPKGFSYLEIKNDNPSDIRVNDKSILIPIIIE